MDFRRTAVTAAPAMVSGLPMIRTAFAALLLVAAAPLAAQSIPSPEKIAALRDAALADTYAWDITEGLTTEVGQRLAGTEAEAQAIGAALAPLGIATGSFEKAEGSDISPMLADGLPGVGLSQDGTRYFDVHHTPDDTLDKVDPVQLRQNVAAWTAVLAVLSGGIEEPKRPKRR